MVFTWYSTPESFPGRSCCVLANHGSQQQPWPCRISGTPCDHQNEPWPAVCATQQRNVDNARRILPTFDAVLAVNSKLADWCRELNPRSYFLPIGIDDRFFHPRDEDAGRDSRTAPLRVGWCGQVDPPPQLNQKGHSWVLEPIRRRGAEFCRFDVNTRSAVDALHRRGMRDWYNGLDVFLCTSISEGSPNTAMEALTCSVPVVGTSVGDLSDLITDGVNGFLTGEYTDSNSADAVVESSLQRLRQLNEDRELLAHLKRQTRSSMLLKRNWRTLASQWLHIVAGD